MSEFEKAAKNLKNDMIVLLILELIILIFSIYYGAINFFSLGYAVFVFVGFFLAKNEKKAAGIIGIIIGILMILSILMGDIIDFLLGLFLLMHSIKYIKCFDEK